MQINNKNYLYKSTDRLIELYDDLTRYALDDIVMRLIKNDTMTSTAKYQVWKLRELGFHFDKIKLYIKHMTKYTDKEIETIFKGAGTDYYKAVKQISIDYGRNAPLNLSTSQFMGDVLSYYIKSTKGTVNNLTRTTINSSQNLLIDKLDQVHFRVVTGIQSYSQAISEAIDEIGKSQLKVTYPNGRKENVEVAIRRSVMTGVNRCFADMNLIRGQNDGFNHVLVSSHLGARHINFPIPEYLSHDIWQGKVYSINWNKVPISNIIFGGINNV